MQCHIQAWTLARKDNRILKRMKCWPWTKPYKDENQIKSLRWDLNLSTKQSKVTILFLDSSISFLSWPTAPTGWSTKKVKKLSYLTRKPLKMCLCGYQKLIASKNMGYDIFISSQVFIKGLLKFPFLAS